MSGMWLYVGVVVGVGALFLVGLWLVGAVWQTAAEHVGPAKRKEGYAEGRAAGQARELRLEAENQRLRKELLQLNGRRQDGTWLLGGGGQ